MLESLKAALGDQLYSCCVYGSVVRGNAVAGVSDLNVLILLRESTPATQEAVANAIGTFPEVDPFVLSQRGFARSVRAFAPKFASIRRNYRVLHGADPLADMEVDAELERFLCEQALRNFRLRLVYSYVTRQRHRSYDKFLLRNLAGLFVQISEVLRLNGLSVPAEVRERIPIFEREFKIDGQVLRDLLALKGSPKRLEPPEVEAWHQRLFPLVDQVVRWIENNWGGE